MKQYDPKALIVLLLTKYIVQVSESYQRIIDHFKPQFLLGMTASPERTDGYGFI